MESLHFFLERNVGYGPNWQVRRINRIEQPEWWNGTRYASLGDFMQIQAKEGNWKCSAVDSGENDAGVSFSR